MSRGRLLRRLEFYSRIGGGASPSTPSKPAKNAAAWCQSRKDAYKFNFPAPSPYKDARQKKSQGGGRCSCRAQGVLSFPHMPRSPPVLQPILLPSILSPLQLLPLPQSIALSPPLLLMVPSKPALTKAYLTSRRRFPQLIWRNRRP